MTYRRTIRRELLRSTSRRFAVERLEPRLVLDAVSELAPAGDATTEIRMDSGTLPFDVTSNDSAESTGLATLRRFSTAEELQDYFLSQAVERWSGTFGTQPLYLVDNDWRMDATVRLGFAVASMNSNGFAETALGSSYSSTNVQVAGVDEGDQVRTDGEYLYIARDNRVLLIDARDPAQLQIASQIPLDEQAGRVFVDGDRLTVVSQYYHRIPTTGDPLPQGTSRLMIYPFDYAYSAGVVVQVFDITDRTAPQPLSRVELDGDLVQSRAVGSRIVLVTQDTPNLPIPEMKCDPSEPGEVEVPAMPEADSLDRFHDPVPSCIYETESEYLARVSPGLLESLLPHATGGDGTTRFLTAPEQVAVLGQFPDQLVSTTVIDVGGETPGLTGSAGILTSFPSTVYATADNVYIATQNWGEDTGEMTTITAFSLGGESGSVRVVAAGSVPGHLLNQFSLDEHEGLLRVATTVWGLPVTNGVYVLESREDQLAVVGSVTGITPGESIVAARFLGDRAYLVTFERIDPLISIDLSDPKQPTIGGELEIPGFSHYLHPLAGGYLIGLGRNADPETGIADDPQLSLFNVQDLSNPTLLDRELIAMGSHAWSQAFFDHHAIQFFDDAGILAIPFQRELHRVLRPFELDANGILSPVVELLADNGADEWERRLLAAADIDHTTRPRSQSGLRVYRVDPTAENPLEAVGLVSHEQLVVRTLRIADVLFAVSEDMVTAHRLTDPNERVGGLYFGRRVFDDTATAAFGGEPIRIDVLANDRVPDDERIVEVSTPANGGKVEISDDGRTVTYTPAAGFAGSETFTYTVDGGSMATVTVHVIGEDNGSPNEPLLRIRLAAIDANGNAITSVELGDSFFVQVFVDDLQEAGQGVFAAYLDLPLDQQLVGVTGDVEFSEDYSNGISGSLEQWGFDELGGFAGSMTPLGNGERLLAAIPFEAMATGTLILAPNPADLSPVSESLLYGRNDLIPIHQLEMTGIELEITNGFHNDLDPADTNVDGTVSPGDALYIINYLNANGSGPLRRLREFDLRTESASGESPRANRKFDANGDGFCTHMDVLSVINRINADIRRRDEAARNAAIPLQDPAARNPDAGWNPNRAEGEGSTADAWLTDSVFLAEGESTSDNSESSDSWGHDSSDALGGLLDDLAADHNSSAALGEQI